MFKTLFSPICINQTKIKNRIVYPSMGLLYSWNGELNDRYFHYYIEKAQGGAGIVTVGPVGVDTLGLGTAGLSIANDQAIPSFYKLTKAIQRAGAKAWIQLFHGGAYVRPIQIGDQQALAPSSIYSEWSKAQAREMTRDDIHDIQEAFVNSAERAKWAGFDGVEIIASAGYLICQFLSPLRNQRTDEYGGSFENRIRFVKEIIEKMRLRLGTDYPITIRMAGNDFVPGSNTDLETPEFARVYEKAGIDAINVTGGWHETNVPQMTMSVPQGAFTYLAQNIKNVVSIPVMASNRISEPWLAEKIIHDGWADMVSLGRVLMADPYWPQKAQAGHPEQITPCVACLQGCMDEIVNMKPVKCMVNARLGFEGERRIARTDRSKRVMVVGAGPGGMEAAFRAAQAGHQVELYEKADRIGGQLWIAGAPPYKQELLKLIPYYQEMLKHHKVQVFLNTEVDIKLVKQRSPEYLIAAEGAEAVTPAIDGFDDSRIISAWDILKHNIALGKKIAVIGGGAVGLETAHFIAAQGTITPETLHFLFSNNAESPERLRQLIFQGNKKVTVFEMMPQVGKGIGKSSKWGLLSSLRKYGVNINTGATVHSFHNGILNYELAGERRSESFDNIINATGSQSLRKLANALEETRIPFAIIGDSLHPGQIIDAIHQAYQAVMDHL